MSEKREHRRRYNLRLEYIARFENWLNNEPPMILFWKWKNGKKNVRFGMTSNYREGGKESEETEKKRIPQQIFKSSI